MTIEFSCQGCGRPIRLPDHAAGRRAKCRGCGAVVTVPAASPAKDGGAAGREADLYGLAGGEAVDARQPAAPLPSRTAAPQPQRPPAAAAGSSNKPVAVVGAVVVVGLIAGAVFVVPRLLSKVKVPTVVEEAVSPEKRQLTESHRRLHAIYKGLILYSNMSGDAYPCPPSLDSLAKENLVAADMLVSPGSGQKYVLLGGATDGRPEGSIIVYDPSAYGQLVPSLLNDASIVDIPASQLQDRLKNPPPTGTAVPTPPKPSLAFTVRGYTFEQTGSALVVKYPNGTIQSIHADRPIVHAEAERFVQYAEPTELAASAIRMFRQLRPGQMPSSLDELAKATFDLTKLKPPGGDLVFVSGITVRNFNVRHILLYHSTPCFRSKTWVFALGGYAELVETTSIADRLASEARARGAGR